MGNVRREARDLLCRMALLSYGEVAALERRRGGERERIGPPGDSTPMHETWGERFDDAEDAELPALIAEARAELDAWVRRPLAPDTTESWEELAARIVGDGWGVSADHCSRAMRCTPSMVRRARLAAFRHPESGYPLPAESSDRMAWARILDAAGLSLRQVQHLTGVPKSTLYDRLGRAVVAHDA